MLSGRVPECHASLGSLLPLARQTRKCSAQSETEWRPRLANRIQPLESKGRDAPAGAICAGIQDPDDVDAVAGSVGPDTYDRSGEPLVCFHCQVTNAAVEVCRRAPESTTSRRRIRIREVCTHESNDISDIRDRSVDAEAHAHSRGRHLGPCLNADNKCGYDQAFDYEWPESEYVMAENSDHGWQRMAPSLSLLTEANQALGVSRMHRRRTRPPCPSLRWPRAP